MKPMTLLALAPASVLFAQISFAQVTPVDSGINCSKQAQAVATAILETTAPGSAKPVVSFAGTTPDGESQLYRAQIDYSTKPSAGEGISFKLILTYWNDGPTPCLLTGIKSL